MTTPLGQRPLLILRDGSRPLHQAKCLFFILPILSRNPVDLDHTELSHKRLQGSISKAAIGIRDSESLYVPTTKRCYMEKYIT